METIKWEKKFFSVSPSALLVAKTIRKSMLLVLPDFCFICIQPSFYLFPNEIVNGSDGNYSLSLFFLSISSIEINILASIFENSFGDLPKIFSKMFVDSLISQDFASFYTKKRSSFCLFHLRKKNCSFVLLLSSVRNLWLDFTKLKSKLRVLK